MVVRYRDTASYVPGVSFPCIFVYLRVLIVEGLPYSTAAFCGTWWCSALLVRSSGNVTVKTARVSGFGAARVSSSLACMPACLLACLPACLLACLPARLPVSYTHLTLPTKA